MSFVALKYVECDSSSGSMEYISLGLLWVLSGCISHQQLACVSFCSDPKICDRQLLEGLLGKYPFLLFTQINQPLNAVVCMKTEASRC